MALLHFPIFAKFIGRTTGSSFTHEYLLEQYAQAEKELKFILGEGENKSIDRAIHVASFYKEDDFIVFLE